MGPLTLPMETAATVEWKRHGGLLVPPWWEIPPARPTGIDLFCGCGGFSLGFIQAGFEVVAAVDNDPTAMMTYLTNLGSYPVKVHCITTEDEERLEKAWEKELKRASKRGKGSKLVLLENAFRSGTGWITHHPEAAPVRNVWFGDARQLNGKDILDALGMEVGQVDCVFGGPPCQGFSKAGKRNVMDPRNSLVFEFVRLVLDIRPKTICFENVPGIIDMITPEGEPVVDAICRLLEEGDYGKREMLQKALSSMPNLKSAGRGDITLKHYRERRKKAKAAKKPEPGKGGDQLALFERKAS